MTAMLKPWLVLAVIFVAGGLSGSALTMVLASHSHRPPGQGKIEKLIMMRMTSELNLTPDQQDKIRPIVGEAAKEFQEVHHDEIRRILEIIKVTNDQITPMLSTDQKAQLDKLQAEGDNVYLGRPHGWGPPGEHFRGGEPNDGGPPPTRAGAQSTASSARDCAGPSIARRVVSRLL